MRVLFSIFLLTYFGALNFFFSGSIEDYGEAKAQGLVVINLLQLGAGVVALGLVLASPSARASLKRSWPLLAICALATLSAAWSPDPAKTVRTALALVIMTLLATALVDRLGPHAAVRCLITSMTVACLLSIMVVIIWPTTSVHQATDSFQSVHAGLWRGVLAHKVSLGIFSGLLIGLALTAHASYASLPLRLLALASGLTCLIGSGSATGIVTASVYIFISLAAKSIVKRPPSKRQGLSVILAVCLIVLGYFFFTGQLDRWAVLLGRSPDLTGRATYWPHIIDFVKSYAPTLGFGYGAGYRFIGPLLEARAGTRLTEAHNGLIELLVAFGYLGASFVCLMIALFLRRAVRLIAAAPRELAPIAIVPLVALSANILTSYAESIVLMPAGIWTMAFMIAVAVLSRLEVDAGRRVERSAPVSSAPTGPFVLPHDRAA